MSNMRVLATDLEFPEGPVVMPDGSVVLVEIRGQRLTRVHPDGRKDIVAQIPGGPNGAALGPDGKMYVCNNGGFSWIPTRNMIMPGPQPADYQGGSIQRIDLQNGKVETVVDRCGEHRLRGPNDLVFDKQGNLWFTDPPYGLPGTFKDPGKELDFQGVYRVANDGTLTLATKELEAPNGLAFTPDYKTLYVANSQAELPIWKAFPVKPDGTLGPSRVFYDATKLRKDGDGNPDGMKVDVNGNVFATGPGGVLVLTPDGTLLGRILTGVPTANVAWGENGSTLFVTANHRVLRLVTKTKGMLPPMAK